MLKSLTIYVSLLGSLLFLSNHASSFTNTSDLRVQIFYYGWYYNRPGMGETWTSRCRDQCQMPERIASSFYPKLGAYHSDDKSVIRQHMYWINQMDINVIILSWWGQNSYEDQLIPLILDIAAEYNIKVAFHIEPYGWGPKRDSALKVIGDIQYIYNKYGNYPAFLRVSRPTKYGPNQKNRGVFYIFDPYKFGVSDKEWRSVLDEIRGTPNDAIVIAQTTDPNRIDQAHFDGIYTYDVLQLDGTTFQSINNEVTKRNSIFAPSVGPGYKDERASWGSPSRYKDRRGGKTYDEMWKRAINSKAEWITITSFNEWHEGTQIEPATPKSVTGFPYLSYEGDYGLTGQNAEMAYITRTAYWVTQLQTSPPPTPRQKPQDRTLIRTKNGIDVFWYQNSKRYHVLNPDILNKMAGMPGWGWNLVYEFDPSEIEKIPQGPKFIAPDNRSNGILIRQQGTNEVYKIENGKRQYVSFDECNRTNCWNNVIEVTSEIIGLFNQIPKPSRNFLVCAAGEDSLIDDLEIVGILDAWQKQKDYRSCGVPTDDDYMRALNLWQKRQPVNGSPPPGPNPPPATQKPIARFTMAASTGQSAKENEQLTLTVDKGKTAYILFNADNSYDPDGGSIRSYQWRINGTFVASTGRFAFDLGAGRHDIFLMVTDDEGQTGAVGATIVITEDTSINNPPIISSLTYEPRSPTPDDTIYFEVLASDPEGDPLTYEWYLNGVKQTNATAARVQWANPSEGTHTMAVKASDNKGGTAQATVTFTVASPSRGQTPQIVSVDIPNKITINTETRWELSFYDPNGDINWIRFEHYKNGQWVGIGEGDPKVYGQMRGTISIITTCDTLGIRTHRAILRDARGNESIPYEYSFECVAGYRQNPPVALLTISGYDSFSGYRSASNSETLNLTLNFASSTEINFSSNSYDPNSENLSYEWFINGQLVSTTDNFTQTLEAGNPLIEGAREYEVVLRVTNRSGLQAIAYARIIIAVVYVEVLPGYIIKSSSSQTFIVTAMNKMIDLHIYDSGGRLVYHIAELPPRYQWRWNMRDQYGARVPNGVYLVVITVRDLSGYPMRREVKKIVVLG